MGASNGNLALQLINEIQKEAAMVGHGEPITKKETIELLSKEDSMCKIFSRKIKKGKLVNIIGTGFFLNIKNKNIPFKKCLITNNHILDEKDIETSNKIKIEYKTKIK